MKNDYSDGSRNKLENGPALMLEKRYGTVMKNDHSDGSRNKLEKSLMIEKPYGTVMKNGSIPPVQDHLWTEDTSIPRSHKVKYELYSNEGYITDDGSDIGLEVRKTYDYENHNGEHSHKETVRSGNTTSDHVEIDMHCNNIPRGHLDGITSSNDICYQLNRESVILDECSEHSHFETIVEKNDVQPEDTEKQNHSETLETVCIVNNDIVEDYDEVFDGMVVAIDEAPGDVPNIHTFYLDPPQSPDLANEIVRQELYNLLRNIRQPHQQYAREEYFTDEDEEISNLDSIKEEDETSRKGSIAVEVHLSPQNVLNN